LYTSSTIQNEIVEACNRIVLKKLVSRLNGARCFLVLADETTDVSTQQQMTIVARYVDVKEGKLRENFLQNEPVSDATGEKLAETIVKGSHSYGVSITYLRGQGYDGASSMSGAFQGVQAHVRKQYPLAHYVHCASHVLNFAVCDDCDLPPVRNCIGTAKATYTFFKTPKRQQALATVFEKKVPREDSEAVEASMCHKMGGKA